MALAKTLLYGSAACTPSSGKPLSFGEEMREGIVSVKDATGRNREEL